MSETVLDRFDDGVLTVTLNRPERLNAMTAELLARLLEVLTDAARRPEVGAVVLAGAGRAFCAGGDVGDMADAKVRRPTFDESVDNLRGAMEISRLLHDMPKPTIAMLRGAVAGAGLSIALACDLRIASDTLKLTTAFAKVGLSGDFGGTWFLTNLVGSAKARELYLLSPILRADEAERLGLVSRVVADAELESETLKAAAALARGPRVTLSYIKKNLNQAERGTLNQSLDMEAIHHIRCGGTEDHREAAAAFVEKRAPVFKGR